VEARVLTVVPLDEALRVALEANLAKRFDKKVILENVIDESILGGAVVYVGDQVIDGSIKNQLNQMKTQMNSLRLH
jgi:F-type H+-transporting ATPase subunit delta